MSPRFPASHLDTLLVPRPQRRMLSLDGGGIRDILALGILKEIETQLRAANPQHPDLLLRDYFDFIGGTSTRAIIAVALSIGMSVDPDRRTPVANGNV